jgi:hypothetical protein
MKIRLSKNKPLDQWYHGEKRDPKNWPWWKIVMVTFNKLSIHPPSTAYRLWIYTRHKGHDFDITFDRRLEAHDD